MVLQVSVHDSVGETISGAVVLVPLASGSELDMVLGVVCSGVPEAPGSTRDSGVDSDSVPGSRLGAKRLQTKASSWVCRLYQ